MKETKHGPCYDVAKVVWEGSERGGHEARLLATGGRWKGACSCHSGEECIARKQAYRF